MMAVMVAPFGRLNSASTTACLDLPVLEWTTRFGFFAFHRLFAPDRGFALGRPLVLVISDPLWVSAHQRAAPPQPRGGRPALAGERSLEAISIGLHWRPLTLCLLAISSVQRVILLLILAPFDHSWIARGHCDSRPLWRHGTPAMQSFCRALQQIRNRGICSCCGTPSWASAHTAIIAARI